MRTDRFNDYEEESVIDPHPVTERDMFNSARDWEIIRNKHFGTNDRVWSTDDDYPVC